MANKFKIVFRSAAQTEEIVLGRYGLSVYKHINALGLQIDFMIKSKFLFGIAIAR